MVITPTVQLLQYSLYAQPPTPPLDHPLLAMMQAHPTASFMAGMAAATLLKGKPSLAATLWEARKGKPK